MEGREDCSGMYSKMKHKSGGSGIHRFVDSVAQGTTSSFVFQCLQAS